MTILHDNLYTKRAVATCRGRNRYLSRAMSVKWVPPWPKERRPRKKHETMKKRPNSTTCWGTLLATLVPWNNRRKLPHLRPKSHLKSQHQAALRPVHLQALRPVHLQVPPAALPPVLLRVRPAAHPAVLLVALPPALRPVHPQALPAPPLPRLKPKSKPSPRPRPLLLSNPSPRPFPQRSPKR